MRLLTLAALAAVAPAIAHAQTTPMVPVDGTLLEVSATGKTTRVPDLASIRAGVVTTAPSAAAALSDNAQRMARVLAALKKAGVADRDVQTSQIALQPQYKYVQNETPVITGYQATNSVQVRFRDIAKSGTILDVLVREGANQIDGPNLSIDKPEAAEDEARTDAVARARARAELYAKAAGLRVDRILSISEGGGYQPQPMPVFAARAMVSAAPEADSKIAAGEQDVTIAVTVRFILK